MEDKDLIQAYVERCFTDCLFFAQEFLSHLLTSDVPDFHKELYKLLPSEKRLVIAAPRGFAKSTISTVIYPIWLGITGRVKDIAVVSASEGLAVSMLSKVKREFDMNLKLQKFFGVLQTPKWSETQFITSTGVNYRARGAGGQIRGFRPDTLILDDIETDESVDSEEQRKKLKTWLFKACLNTLMPHGQFIMVGSILHPLALLNDLLDSDNGWEKRRYQAYIDGIQEPGHELWPGLWDHDKLQARKREIGTWAFASEYMNNPIADESAAVKPEQIRYWKELPSQISYVITVDPAYTEDEKGDFKVAALIGIDQQMNRYLASYVRNHRPTKEFFDSILNLWMQHKNQVTAIGVPNQGVEKSFFSSFVSYCNERKVYPPIVELKNVLQAATGASIRNKKHRIIASLQPLFEAGKYYIHAEHLEARDELLTIGSSRWDDIVDTMAYAEQVITPVFLEETTQNFKPGRYGSEPNTHNPRLVANYGMD